MAVVVRTCLLLLSIVLVSACGSEDVARPGATRSSGVQADGYTVPAPGNPGSNTPHPGGSGSTPPPQDDGGVTPPPGEDPDDGVPSEEEPVEEEPGDDHPDVEVPPVDVPDDDATPPAQEALDTNVFFPVIPDMRLYFGASTVPAQVGAAQRMGTDVVYPLQYEDLLSNYFTSTTATVGLKGVRILLLEQATPVYLDVQFASSRPILGDSTSYNTTGTTTVQISTIAGSYTFSVRLTSTLVASEWIAIPGLAPQPARHVRISQQLSVSWLQRQLILLRYPWLAPAFDPVTFDLWLVPGIGVVKAQMAGVASQVQAVAGVPEPLVFSFRRNATIDSIAPQTLLVDGQAVTDLESQPTLHYRTADTNWLDVTFDSTGSWHARITRTNLPRGVHAAIVRFGEGDQARDVTVSLMVE